jgi:hypothetical protein
MARDSEADAKRAKRFHNIGSDDGFYGRAQSLSHPAYLEGYAYGHSQFDSMPEHNGKRDVRAERERNGRDGQARDADGKFA